MPLKVKICGLINKDSVITSINGGASYCGFILNYPKSHRYIYDISWLKVKIFPALIYIYSYFYHHTLQNYF